MITPTGEFIDGGVSETGIIEYEDGLTIALSDLDPPIVSVDPPPGDYTQPVDVSFSINEPGIVYYRLDGGVEQVYDVPIHLLAPTFVQYHGVDLAGNIEVQHEIFYNVDITLTTLSHVPGYHAQAIDVTLSNELSLPITYSLNGGPWLPYTAPLHLTESISTVLQYRSGIENIRTATFEIDESPLQVTSTLPANDTYRKVVVSFSKNHSDGKVFVAINNGAWEEYIAPFNAPAGNTTVRYYSTYNGHTYPTVTHSYIINPKVVFVEFSPLPINTADLEEADISLTPYYSGTLYYQLDEGEWLVYGQPVTVRRGETLRARLNNRTEIDEMPYHVENTVDRWEALA